MNLSNVQIDKTDINQSLLDISDKSRTSNFSWKGQFSPEFIEAILEKYTDSNSVLYDPFLGSGTVVSESLNRDLEVCGIELNPAAYHMAKFYELGNCPTRYRNKLINYYDERLNNIMTEKDFTEFIDFCKHPNLETTYNNIAKLLLILSDLNKNELNITILSDKWGKLKELIKRLPYSKKKIDVLLGDSRRTKFKSNYATIVLTSPPYINVFNYHQNYRKSTEFLGYDVLNIAKSEFGSNRKHRGNRFYTVIQYSIDMALSILESLRISKMDARLIFIVGIESTVLGHKFCNSQIIFDIFNSIFNCPLLLRQQRVFKNRYGIIIKEDILHFAKKVDVTLSKEEIVTMARKIGVQELKKALSDNDPKRDLIMDAIEKSNNINESELSNHG